MIITISREFGSGGRELGKRLSETLQIPCYDKEIIALIAKEQGLDERYLTHISEKGFQASYPLTIGRRFAMTPHPVTQQKIAARFQVVALCSVLNIQSSSTVA